MGIFQLAKEAADEEFNRRKETYERMQERASKVAADAVTASIRRDFPQVGDNFTVHTFRTYSDNLGSAYADLGDGIYLIYGGAGTSSLYVGKWCSHCRRPIALLNSNKMSAANTYILRARNLVDLYTSFTRGVMPTGHY